MKQRSTREWRERQRQVAGVWVLFLVGWCCGWGAPTGSFPWGDGAPCGMECCDEEEGVCCYVVPEGVLPGGQRQMGPSMGSACPVPCATVPSNQTSTRQNALPVSPYALIGDRSSEIGWRAPIDLTTETFSSSRPRSPPALSS